MSKTIVHGFTPSAAWVAWLSTASRLLAWALLTLLSTATFAQTGGGITGGGSSIGQYRGTVTKR